MATSGAARTITFTDEQTQEFEREIQSDSEFNSQDVLKANTVIQDIATQEQIAHNQARPDSEGNKQNAVDTKVNEIGSQTEASSHDLWQPTFEHFAPMEQTMSLTGSENIGYSKETTADTAIGGLKGSFEGDSQQRLQVLMKEFKALLADYQQQTLKLAKSFANMNDANSGSKPNLDLSSIGNVVIQQKDIDGYQSGLDQLTQTLNTMESELEASLRKAEYQELSRNDLEAAYLEMLERLASTSEKRFTTTPELAENINKSRHLDRVGTLCAQIAQTLGCSEAFTNMIGSSARLHDIGKIAIPDSILQKPDRLDADEYATMKMHTIHGSEMLANNSSEILQMAQRIALSHHENWDGTGYPYQLKREEIVLEGRIAAVADVYDALISSRIYKEAWPKEKAIEQIKSRSGTKFDPDIVEAFLKVVA